MVHMEWAILLQQNCVLLVLDERGLQGFDDITKVDLLVFLELWLRTYPLSCGLG